MIVKQFNTAHVLYQKATETDLPEQAIAVSVDNGGIIVLQQEDRQILVNPQSVTELCWLLKKLAQDVKGD